MTRLLGFLLIFGSLKSWAYPEMIRHHYINCTACHFSPAGGGLLNPYGRTISGEVLSTWDSEKEARPFYGALDHELLNKWLAVGGDIRVLQFHHDSATVTEGKTIPMQAGIEFAGTVGKWTLDLFYGKLNPDWHIEPAVTRYFAMYQFLDELTLRMGRFIPVFGINIPQHTVVTRSGLGFNEGQERNALEAMWSGEKWNFTVTGSQSIASSSIGETENALTTQVNYTIEDSYRVGASYWLGASDTMNRQVFALQAVLGFSEKLYLLTEVDYQLKSQLDTNKQQKGLYDFVKLGYEFYKGVHLQIVQEFSQSNLENGKSRLDSLGPGLLFYPRPHFEFELLYTKKKIAGMSDDYQDYAYLMGHYYL